MEDTECTVCPVDEGYRVCSVSSGWRIQSVRTVCPVDGGYRVYVVCVQWMEIQSVQCVPCSKQKCVNTVTDPAHHGVQ